MGSHESENSASTAGQITAWLQQAGQGDPDARDRAYRLVQHELKRIAKRNMSRRDQLSLHATSIADDAFLKLMNLSRVAWNDRQHFFAFACDIVRQILIDHARKRVRRKNNLGKKPADIADVGESAGPDAKPSQAIEDYEELLALDQRRFQSKDSSPQLVGKAESMLALDSALKRLEQSQPDLANVIILRYFGGWSPEQIGAEILNCHPGSVNRKLLQARTLLHSYLLESQEED